VTAAVVALGLVVALLSVLVVGLLRSHAEILKALHGLGVDLNPASAGSAAVGVPKPTPGPLGAGATVPDSIVGLDTTGGAISVALVGEGRLTLLAFLSSGCLTCRPMWEAMAAGEGAIPGGARPVAVTKGPHEESPASVQSLTSARLTTVMSSEAWASFNVPGSPYFVLVDGTGNIAGEGTAGTWPRVLELLGEALADDSATGFQSGPSGPPRGSGRERLQHVDDTLRAAGIEAGHPSLHPEDQH
jgi:hypothetical protein